MNLLTPFVDAARGSGPAAGSVRTATATSRFYLVAASDQNSKLAAGWLILGVGALVASGLFSLLLVFSRTPGLNRLIPVADLFHVSLVVHVDLSVLVWFAAFAGALWTFAGSRKGMTLGWTALIVCGIGTTLIAAAPFLGNGAPIMSNYVPVLDSRVFIAGLVVFGLGVAIEIVRGFVLAQPLGHMLDGPAALRLGLAAAAVSAAVALFAFMWSWLALPAGLDAKTYYELLFWGAAMCCSSAGRY